MPTVKHQAKVINLGARKWIGEIRDNLPEGKTLREACIEAQRAEVELFIRLQNGRGLRG